MTMPSSVVIKSCVVTVCSCRLGRFCCICRCPSAPRHRKRQLRAFASASSDLNELHNTPFLLALITWFSQSIRFSWFRTSQFFFCSSVSPNISTSYIGSDGSTCCGFARSKFRIYMTSFANTAISSMAAHLDHSNGGSADALSQNGLIFIGFLEYPDGCAMSYRKV